MFGRGRAGRSWATAGLIAVIVGAGCGSTTAAPSNGASARLTTVNVGVASNSAAGLFVEVAQRTGIARKNGLNIVVDGGIAPADQPAAMVHGALQATTLGANTGTIAARKGIPIVNVALTTSVAPFVLLAAPGIHSMSDLIGQEIVTSTPADSPYRQAEALLSKFGLAGKVKLLGVASVPAASTLFVAKKVAAMFEATNIALVDIPKRPGSSIIASAAMLPPALAGDLAVTRSFLAAHPLVVRELVRSGLQAAHLMKYDPAKALPAAEESENLTAAQARELLSQMSPSLTDTGVPTNEEFQDQAQQLSAVSGSSGGAPWTAKEVEATWDTSIAMSVAKQLGYVK